MKAIQLFAITTVALGVAACGLKPVSGAPLKGSKKVESEPRTLTPFKKVEVSGVIILDFNAGPVGPVVVTADDNIIPNVITEVKGDTLLIAMQGGATDFTPIHVKVSIPDVTSINASGASTANVIGVKASDLDLTVSGAAILNFEGTAENIRVKGSGSTRIDAKGIFAKKISGELKDASRLTLNGATDQVALNLFDASNLDAAQMNLRTGTINLAGASHAVLAEKSMLIPTLSGASTWERHH